MPYTTHRLTPEARDFTPFTVGWLVCRLTSFSAQK